MKPFLEPFVESMRKCGARELAEHQAELEGGLALRHNSIPVHHRRVHPHGVDQNTQPNIPSQKIFN